MCGRYQLNKDPKSLLKEYFPGINFDSFEFRPNLDVRPTHDCPVVIRNNAGEFCTLLKWGLIPSWCKEYPPKIAPINARSETLGSKPTFKASFRRKRCVIPSTSFYEWKKEAGTGKKIPYRFFLPDRDFLLFAGLWDQYEGPKAVLQTFTILTTAANDSVADLHDRMPVILDKQTASKWLAPGEETDKLVPLFSSQSQPSLQRELAAPETFMLKRKVPGNLF